MLKSEVNANRLGYLNDGVRQVDCLATTSNKTGRSAWNIHFYEQILSRFQPIRFHKIIGPKDISKGPWKLPNRNDTTKFLCTRCILIISKTISRLSGEKLSPLPFGLLKFMIRFRGSLRKVFRIAGKANVRIEVSTVFQYNINNLVKNRELSK